MRFDSSFWNDKEVDILNIQEQKPMDISVVPLYSWKAVQVNLTSMMIGILVQVINLYIKILIPNSTPGGSWESQYLDNYHIHVDNTDFKPFYQQNTIGGNTYNFS